MGDKTEDDIVAWANGFVADSGLQIKICEKIEPRAVNQELVTAGETDEDKKLNAMYVISLARKLNAIIFCVWEDMVNVNPKQIFIFLATMMDIAANYKPTD